MPACVDARSGSCVTTMGFRFDQAAVPPRGSKSTSAMLGRLSHGAAPRALEIGLVNNMPDAAVRATERHFAALITATGMASVRLHFFALPEIVRAGRVAAHIGSHYHDITALDAVPLDGLIVTGTEPRGALRDAPYWARLTGLIDWAEHNTISTIFSCLASHALVLHLDGIERNRLATKRFGVFDFAQVGASSLLADMPAVVPMPHSRWNDVAASDLTACGYEILTAAPEAGVDIFVKCRRSLFVGLQGHPEYEADTLLREYRRDLDRFRRGEVECPPTRPSGYLDVNGCNGAAVSVAPAVWRRPAVVLMRNWLAYIAANRSQSISAALGSVKTCQAASSSA
jgi:homoserine O-succinyltransferase